MAEWRFDEGAGQIVTDYSGQGNHLQLGPTSGVDTDEPTWAPYGIDCVLNAANNHLRANGNIGIVGTQARTVIAVAQIDTAFSGINHGVSFFAWIGDGTSGRRWSLRNQSGATPLRLEVQGTSQSVALDLSDETWHFIAATQSGANINTAVIYLDGASAAITSSAVINTTGNLVVLGQESAESGAARWGKGTYGLVYNRALSAVEIEQNRQALKTILAPRGITLP